MTFLVMSEDTQQLNHVITTLTSDKMKLEATCSELTSLGAMKDMQIAKLEKDYEDLEG